MMYFIMIYLHLNHITNHTRKAVIMVVFLVIIVLILPMRFFLNPPRWDIEYRLLLGIDKLSISVYMTSVFVQDINLRILFALFVSLVVLLEIHQTDPYLQPITNVITGSFGAVIFLIIFWLYMRVTSGRTRKIIVATLFSFMLLGLTVTYVFSVLFSHWNLLFNIMYCINIPLLFLYPLYTSTYERFQDNDYNFLDLTELPTRFTFKDLNQATRNFEIPIGKSASSTVFKGMLRDGTVVAVKQINGQSNSEDQFNTEIAIIASVQHINLMRLLGYCLTPRGERYLVYPFFENGSLDTWLFAAEERRSRLTWALRYEIAVDVAKALAYLHHDCRHQIIHLDVKPANILLGRGFQALLSDFGISRAMSREDDIVMTRARGTVGYLPPEMLITTAMSTKSDVYSYGMVLLELVGGRRNLEIIVDAETQQRKNSYFPKIARKRMLEGNLWEVVDQSFLSEQVKENEIRVLVSVAFNCIHDRPERRPSMADVVGMLKGDLPVHLPPESPVSVADFLDVESESSTTESLECCTVRTVDGMSQSTEWSNSSISIRIE
ncbi:Receptor protein kinase [Rhynchospora pubera]|uniref:Receptor protein kinase n=1 Tax=Rhynchospora pubera TaxID=906938 RepID=A0AAV8GUD7_9POAL|nr:Receptor protein kinase [Rhynchospora pubera]